jgi:hypothetical protein
MFTTNCPALRALNLKVGPCRQYSTKAQTDWTKLTTSKGVRKLLNASTPRIVKFVFAPATAAKTKGMRTQEKALDRKTVMPMGFHSQKSPINPSPTIQPQQ